MLRILFSLFFNPFVFNKYVMIGSGLFLFCLYFLFSVFFVVVVILVIFLVVIMFLMV
jgi:hypothetical protein